MCPARGAVLSLHPLPRPTPPGGGGERGGEEASVAPSISAPDVQLRWGSDWFPDVGHLCSPGQGRYPLCRMREESAFVVRSGRLWGSLTRWSRNNHRILGSCSLCKSGAEVPPTSWEQQEEDGDFIRSCVQFAPSAPIGFLKATGIFSCLSSNILSGDPSLHRPVI